MSIFVIAAWYWAMVFSAGLTLALMATFVAPIVATARQRLNGTLAPISTRVSHVAEVLRSNPLHSCPRH